MGKERLELHRKSFGIGSANQMVQKVTRTKKKLSSQIWPGVSYRKSTENSWQLSLENRILSRYLTQLVCHLLIQNNDFCHIFLFSNTRGVGILWSDPIDMLTVTFAHSLAYWYSIEHSALAVLRPKRTGRHFPDDISRCIFFNENVWILIKISLKFVPKGIINNIPALVQIMACRLVGAKPLSEPMMVILLTHICVTRPQWVLG